MRSVLNRVNSCGWPCPTQREKNGRVFDKMKAIPGTFPLGFFFVFFFWNAAVPKRPHFGVHALLERERKKGEKINKIRESRGEEGGRARRGLKQRESRLNESREGWVEEGVCPASLPQDFFRGSCPHLTPPR